MNLQYWPKYDRVQQKKPAVFTNCGLLYLMVEMQGLATMLLLDFCYFLLHFTVN